MTINVRYAQNVPEVPKVVEGEKGVAGVAGVPGVAGAAGADLINLPPLYFDTNDETNIVLDLALSRTFRIVANSGFSLSFINPFDGVQFRVSVIQNTGIAETPSFLDTIYWNEGGTAPVLADIEGDHTTYEFEYWELDNHYDGFLKGTAMGPEGA